MVIDLSKLQAKRWETPNAVRMRVSVCDIEPAIWRELVVPSTTTLAQLHHVIQVAFGWRNAHLHEFDVGGLTFGDARGAKRDGFAGDRTTFDARKVTLKDFSFRYGEGPSFLYRYDFGDDWEHLVELQEQVTLIPEPTAASCVAGARSGPPDDVGGPPGYEEFLRVVLKPKKTERAEQRRLKEWIGGDFDPERFDIDLINRALLGAHLKRYPG